MKSVALQIQEYLERRTEWVNGGDLERMTFITEKGSRAKPSNISKRLRELSAAEKIRKDLREGSVWYHRAEKEKEATISGVTIPIFKAQKQTGQKLL